jgi:hypothetical protein
MKTLQKLLAVALMSGMCLAAPAPDSGVAGAKKHKKAKATATEEKRCEACEAIEQLKEQIKAQQARIEAQQSQIDQLKTVQAPQPATTDEQARAAAAEAKKAAEEAAATAAQANANANALKSDVSDLKESNMTAVQAVQETQKRVTDLEAPPYLHYKNIQFIPGGFLAAESVWRQHAEQTDVLSNSFAKVPFPGTINNGNFPLTEWRATGRQSRLSFKAIGNIHDVKLLGYYEMDFLGAAPTANENQSNSFNIRQRQLYADAEWHGWGFAGGQMWSLTTLNKQGAAPYAWWNPSTIDAQYVPGFTFARQAGFRVYKQLNKGHETVAFAVENAAILSSPDCTPAVCGGPGNQSFGNTKNFTDSIAPDLIAKVAFDPSFGHFEIKAVGRFFRSRIGSTATGHNETTEGGGIGAGLIVPIDHKKINLVAQALVGRGTARYGDSGVVDVTFRPNGEFSPVKNLQGLGGIEAQVTPKLQFYVYGGDEYWGRDLYAGVGYGAPNAGNQRNVVQGTGGFWYTMYKGGYGSLLSGVQYSYTYLTTWNTPAATATSGPKTSENMAFTSLRYFLP